MLCAMRVWLEHGINLRDGFYKKEPAERQGEHLSSEPRRAGQQARAAVVAHDHDRARPTAVDERRRYPVRVRPCWPTETPSSSAGAQPIAWRGGRPSAGASSRSTLSGVRNGLPPARKTCWNFAHPSASGAAGPPATSRAGCRSRRPCWRRPAAADHQPDGTGDRSRPPCPRTRSGGPKPAVVMPSGSRTWVFSASSNTTR